MSSKSKLLIGALVVAALGAATTLALAQYRMGYRGHEGMRGGMGLHLAMFCGDGSRVDRMLERLEERIKPTDAQKNMFAEFKTAAKTAVDKVKTSCPIERPRNVPERLAMAEKRAEAALDALRTVRPAADKLYAALSDEQKAELNGLRRHWRGPPDAAVEPKR
jgi:LTXXQ motif family protein